MNEKYVKLIDEKMNELKGRIAVLKTDDSIKTSTRSTQLFTRRKEVKVLSLIKHLLEEAKDVKLTDDEVELLISLTTLVEERRTTVFTISEGETIMDVLARYPNKKNLGAAVQKYCSENNLVLGPDGVFTAGGNK